MILDKKQGFKVDLKDMYESAMSFEMHDIASALDGGTETDIKNALVSYIKK